MIGALYSGISGLNSFQGALNTESNNISNVNTIGYKSDQISFADLMYQGEIGMGVSSKVIDKNFTQGSLKLTDSPYDMAIEGKGFFMVKGDTNEVLYTRAGDFRMGEDGTLQMPNGYNIQGVVSGVATYNATNANDTAFTDEYSNFVASQVIKTNNGSNIENVNVKTTNYNESASDDSITNSGNNYKTKEAKISDVEQLISSYKSELNLYSSLPTAGVAATKQESIAQFDTSLFDANTTSVEIKIGNTNISQGISTNSTSLAVNIQTTLNLLADKISAIQGMKASVNTTGQLQISSLVPGVKTAISDASIVSGESKIASNITTTNPIIGSGKAKLDAIEVELKAALENANAKYLKQTTNLDTTGTVVSDIQLKLDTLGYSSSPFGTPEVVDGVIYMTQGDNRFAIAKVSTAVFTNEMGLDPKGGNMFSQTVESGVATLGTIENKVLGNALELSNSDLSENLVNLMVFQRSFEASSKSITTSDEFLKTAIALKK